MYDFFEVKMKQTRKGVEIFPEFKVCNSKDLMVRGRDFYAIWDPSQERWSTNELTVFNHIDDELFKYKEENNFPGQTVSVLTMKHTSSGMVDNWHKFVQRQMRDNYVTLDTKLMFANDVPKREDYSSKSLPYALEPGDISAYEELISTLYTPDERHKIEWAIGSVIAGESKHIQKFFVLYGDPGTGKSTILNIIEDLFEGYFSIFDAKAIGMSSNQFAVEMFKTNPLVMIQHDGDLSKIEDNSRLNSIASHEIMLINEKFKSPYALRLISLMFMGTNKPVKITDSKSGMLRRLVDIHPSGNKVSSKRYYVLMDKIKFELGGIAYHCLQVFKQDPHYYDNYVPIRMMIATNDVYDFFSMEYDYMTSKKVFTTDELYKRYKIYCEDSSVQKPMQRRIFQEDITSYFEDFKQRGTDDEGKRVRNMFTGFKTSKFDILKKKDDKVEEEQNSFEESLPSAETLTDTSWLSLTQTSSIFDTQYSDCPAQYANSNETPLKPWDEVTTTLADISTKKLHYVRVPEYHIVIDFDIRNDEGKKDFAKNLNAASKWPKTYAELSKGGAGIHLHYIYEGDPTKLSRVFADNIEIKVFTGKSSLRRRLTKCNGEPVRTINSGLPLRRAGKVIDFNAVNSEQQLRRMIQKNLEKGYHDATKPSCDFIFKLLQDAYDNGLKYDVTDMRKQVLIFAMNSTNQSDYCVKLVGKMPFKSDEPSENVDSYEDGRIVFFDVEVFQNLFVICWKIRGDSEVHSMINPSPSEVKELTKYRLVGFNCRKYDNHILYAAMMGYNNKKLYNLSKAIINNERNAFFSEAYNLSYTDIYDFSSKKQSLKKFEIDLNIHHQELGLKWDQPVPEELWGKVADYCKNDVIATEAVFESPKRKGDFVAREILTKIAQQSVPNSCVNDTTNSLTTRIIFGKNKKPQSEFNYRDLGAKTDKMPYFEGYKYEYGKSSYRGEEIGEGGYVYFEPGMYGDVALLDIASMHPSSIIAENLFGDRYTKRFEEIVKGRIAVKYNDTDYAKSILDGVLAPYLESGEYSNKDLANALKIAINSVYGLTSASFPNPFRDERNIDNIVAKRGELFMIDLKNAVQEQGFTVAHIKTDSIKIPNATPAIIEFVMEFGKKYGYNFEHEATYDKMCLVNKAAYIARYKSVEGCMDIYGYAPKDNQDHPGEWTAVATQFQVPYVYKTLFTGEKIEFEDLCETMAVTTALYLDMNEGLPDVSEYEAIKDYRKTLAKKGEKGLTKKALRILEEYADFTDEDLDKEIAKGHRYHFVGRVGQFTPVKSGCTGGILLRENKVGGYSAATGSKGFRWLESEVFKNLVEMGELSTYDIDTRYYTNMVDEAVNVINEYGDFEWFRSEDEYHEELPYAIKP